MNLISNNSDLIIFDGGSYIGKTIKIYKSIFPKSKIYGFEPSKNSYQILLNEFVDDEDILIFDYALSNDCNIKTLFLSSSDKLNSLNKPNKRAWGFEKTESLKVQTITIDDFCTENNIYHIDILKLDVQGSELDVIEGAKSMLSAAKIGLIYIEWQVVPLYENHHKFYKIAEILAKYDYHFFNIYNINEARSGQLRWADAIYTSKRIRDKMIDQFGEGTGSGW